MIYPLLSQLVKDNTETLAKTYFNEVKKTDYMRTYNARKEDEVIERGKMVFENLHKWLESGAKNDEIEKYFVEIGRERFKEGFPLIEVKYALYLTKKVFWSFVIWKKEFTEQLNTESAIETMTVLNNYFDIGNFFIIRGYLSELFEHLGEAEHYSKEELQKYLIRGDLHEESIKKIREKMYGEGLSIGLIR